MNEYLSFFLETIGLEKEKAREIIDNPELNTIEEKVKASVLFILKNNPNVKKEIERKILGIDYEKIIEKLKEFGAKETFNGLIKDYRYDFSDDFFKENKILLRIREIKGKEIITLKQKKQKNNSINSDNLEIESEIKNINHLVSGLISFGLNIVEGKHYVKHRISYELDGVHFDFDEYNGDPRLLEIESYDKDKVELWIKKLDLEENEQIGDGYNEYMKKKKLNNK